MNIELMKNEALKSQCKVIKFSASDGDSIFSHNGEFYCDCKDCKRTEIEQSYPECKANHAEWGVLAKLKEKKLDNKSDNIYIYCMTPDEKDYPFKRFWCQTCAILIPMFGIKNVYMWNGDGWILHKSENLIKEVINEE